MFLDWK